jgi:hypothetical protein
VPGLKWRVLFAGAAVFAIAASCADVTTSPSEAGSIEFSPLPAPAMVLGDSLRDIDGNATPIRAIVRNLKGDPLTDMPLQYTYVDASRDTSVSVNPVSGFVVSLKPLGSITIGTTTTAATMARVGARAGDLQAIDTLYITSRPDSADRNNVTEVDTLQASLPDSSYGLSRNTSSALNVTVRNVDSTTKIVSAVSKWLVKFELVQPANAANDTTQGAFLVNDLGVPATIGTTDASGLARVYVRVRPSIFPAAAGVDSVNLRATVTFKGQPVKGSPIFITVPVRKS